MLAWAVGPMYSAYLSRGRASTPIGRGSRRSASSLAAAPGSGRQLAALRGVIATSIEIPRLVRVRWPATCRAACTSIPTCAGGWSPGCARWASSARPRSTPSWPPTTAPRAPSTPRAAARSSPRRGQGGGLGAADARHRTVAHALLYATASGFWHRDHAALTAPYVERYFAEIARHRAAAFGLGGRPARAAGLSRNRSGPADARAGRRAAGSRRCCRPDRACGDRPHRRPAPRAGLTRSASLDSHVA